MKWWRILLVILTCLPATVVGWLVGGLSLITFIAKKPRLDPEMPFVLVVTWRDWFARFWKYSTTISFFIGMHPNADPRDDGRTRKHERVHVRQIIDRALLADVLALFAVFVDPWLGLAVWFTGPIYQLPNFLGVLLRGDGHIYRDAEHERSAYAQTDTRRLEQNESWLDDHLSRDRDW